MLVAFHFLLVKSITFYHCLTAKYRRDNVAPIFQLQQILNFLFLSCSRIYSRCQHANSVKQSPHSIFKQSCTVGFAADQLVEHLSFGNSHWVVKLQEKAQNTLQRNRDVWIMTQIKSHTAWYCKCGDQLWQRLLLGVRSPWAGQHMSNGEQEQQVQRYTVMRKKSTKQKCSL